MADERETPRGNETHNVGSIPVDYELLAKSKVGMWAFEVDEGKEPRLYTDETAREILGMDANLTPEEAYKTWGARLGEEYVETGKEVTEKMTEGITSEFQYVWKNADGTSRILRTVGCRNFSYSKGIRLDGYHQEISDLIQYQLNEQQKRHDKEYLSIIESLTGENDLVLFINLDTGEEIHYKDTGVCGEFLGRHNETKEDNNYNIRCNLFVDEIVVPEERSRVKLAVQPQSIISVLSANKPYVINCRVNVDGKEEWRQIKYIPYHKPGVEHGTIMTIRDTTSEKNDADTTAKMMLVLTSEYERLYLINTDTGEFRVYLSKHLDASGNPEPCLIAQNVFQFLNKYIDTNIYEDDKQKVAAVLSKENILKIANSNERQELIYRGRTLENQEYRWKLNRIFKIPDNSGKNIILMGIKDIHDEKMNAEELGRINSIARYLMGSFSAVFYCGYEDGITLIDCEPGLLEKMQGIYGNINVPFKIPGSFQDNFIWILKTFNTDGDDIIQNVLMNKDALNARLKDAAGFNFILEDNSSGLPKYYRVDVTQGADENHFSLGFTDVTEGLLKDRKQEALINGLSHEYNSLWILDDEEDHLFLFRDGSEEIPEQFRVSEPGFLPYQQSIEKYICDYVNEEDKQRVRDATTLESIRKNTPENGIYAITFMRHIGASDSDYRQICFAKAESNDKSHKMYYVMAFRDIDQLIRDQMEAELKKQTELETMQQFLKTFVDNFVSAYYFDIETGERLYTYIGGIGNSNEYVPYTNVYESTLEYVNHEVHPDDREKMLEISSREYIKERLSKEPEYSEIIRDLSGGVEKYFRFQISRGQDSNHAAGCFTDITKNLEAEHKKQSELETMQQFLQVFVDNFVSAYYFNLNTGERLFSYVKDAELEKKYGSYVNVYDAMRDYINQAIHPADRERLLKISSREYMTERLGKESEFSEIVRDISGGVEKYYRFQVSRGNDSEHAAFCFTDITKDIAYQKEQEESLKSALALANAASRAKTTFLNNMSHDIRTPMNAIIGFTGLAATHIDNKEMVQDYLSKIAKSSDHLLSLINDVLDMSRIESGKMNLNEKPENLSSILHSLKDIVAGDIANKQLDFFIDTVDIHDEEIICDKLRLNQVLLNVLSNSIKYTPPGGTVSVRVSELSCNENGYARYEFRIKDTGVGMSEEFLKTIYDPFTRVNSSTISGIQGTGLGMSITKNIVDMMGGEISITSEENKGTEVVMQFKFKLASGKHNEPKRIAPLEGVRSLVVDDDAGTCMSVSRMLRDCGLRPEWCVSGHEAVLRTQESVQLGDRYRVYIIDWLMPDMNGIETVRRIRKVIGDDVPIIILTAYDYSDVMEEALEAGVTDFVSKPLFPSDLHRVLSRCCGITEDDENPVEAAVEVPDFTGKKILLVEDNDMNREIAEEILSEAGFEVDSVEDGSIAVERMKRVAKGAYDLILMDIQMPMMDGYEATKAIRALPDSCDNKIPIIAMTANAFEEDRQAAFDAGMNEHIPKPVDVKKLIEVLAKILKA